MQKRFVPRYLNEDDGEKKIDIANKIIQPPSEVMLEPIKQSSKPINKVALRRRKVRELRDLGYPAKDIKLILKRGIVVDGIVAHFENLKLKTIVDDLDYLSSEDIAADKSLPEKRAEIMSKYHLIYREVLKIALGERGNRARASYFNIAKNILDKVSELEGVNNSSSFDPSTVRFQRTSQLAEDINEVITDKEKDAINATISQILENGDKGRA